MSGTNGGGGGGFAEPYGSCEALVINTQLSSPKAAVVAHINVADVLDVATQQMGATTVVVALYQGQVAGGLASPEVQRLRECIASGTQYFAKVTDKKDGQVRVRVSAR